MKRSLIVIFNTQVHEDSMGGGDKIVLKISKELVDMGMELKYTGCPEGMLMMDNNVSGISFLQLNNVKISKYGLILGYILRTLSAFKIFFKQEFKKKNYLIWSASDFLPDTFPGFVYKVLNPSGRWFINVFLKARNPFNGEVHLSLNTVLYFISQRITIILFKTFGDTAFVLSSQDREYLANCGLSEKRIIKIPGGTDLGDFDAVKEQRKIYDGCFIGRFHHQKGLPDLIEVWDYVVKKMPRAKLAIIGWGSNDETNKLMGDINKKGLGKNVKIYGFLDGHEKIKVLKSSRLLLFPSKYESWGVVVAEGIAAGVPVIAYKIPQIAGNFKKGVVWVKPFDLGSYKNAVTNLLEDENKIDKISQQARDFRSELAWEHGAKKVFKVMNR